MARLSQGFNLDWIPLRSRDELHEHKFFVDTNILVYAHDRSTGSKIPIGPITDGKALEVRDSGGGVLSMQVLQELCENRRRKTIRPLSVEETSGLIQDYLSGEVVINTAESILQALDIEVRYKISFWDALVVQAPGSSGATILYSEDLSDGQTYGSVRVINPLQGPPSRFGRSEIRTALRTNDLVLFLSNDQNHEGTGFPAPLRRFL